ncbi:hypothetical protein [Saccharomonospora sp. CUA-673]|uniref:hypothetical protein n=1 Tax=Saccharomonospora sp. CUA-673 TaxID=1904969 RepID=UPI003510E978
MTMVTLESRLRQLAFGDVPEPGADPGHRIVGAARTDRERWLAAVALGARGHYAAAATLLESLMRSAGVRTGRRPAVLSSLALSALASHRRQLGGHRAAMRLDGIALARVGGLEPPPQADVPRGHGGDGWDGGDVDGVDAVGAWADAVLGLAADHLGTGRPDLARGLVARVRTVEPVLPWRSRVRANWVGAEAALVAGDAAAPADRRTCARGPRRAPRRQGRRR